MTRRWHLSFVLCLASALAMATRVRADAPRVYVVAIAKDPAHAVDALEIAALARASLASAEGFRFREADAVLRGDSSAAHDAYARALSALRRGRQAYLALELDTALAALAEAVLAFREAGAVVDDPQLVAEALMYLGASQALSGDVPLALRTFTRAHAAFPGLAPDARVFNPEIMARWDEAGAALQKQPRAKLSVRAPEGAEVSVDGRVCGRGALTLDGLAPGEHWVRVSVPGAAPFFQAVLLRPKELAGVDASGLEPNAELEQVLAEAASSEGAARLRERLGVDALAIVHVAGAPGSSELVLTLEAQGTASAPARAPRQVGPELADRAQAVSSLMAAFLDDVAATSHAREQRRLLSERPSDAPVPAEPAERRPWYKRGWVWAVVGGVVVAGAATALALSLGSDDAPKKQHGSDGGTLVLEF